MRSRPILLASVALLLVCGCAPDVQPAGDESGLGTSALAPSLDPAKKRQQPKADKTRSARAHGGSAKSTPKTRQRPASKSAAPVKHATASAPAETRAPVPAPPSATTAAVSDPQGDVQGSLTQAPPYVDLTGARLTRARGGYELRASFAGSVPAKQSDDKTVNVASFYDLDGDGTIDYEVWATLADNGWSGSYRTPSGARFNEDSGVRAHADGQQLVVTFPLGHLNDDDAFRWSVGAEWGSYQQIAAGTTARDNAPDSGVVGFPG